jgi:hypothetical protein
VAKRRVGARGAALLAGIALAASSSVFAADPPAAPPATAETPLDLFFRGAVVGLEGTKVRLRYDFSSPEQMKDWVEAVPFQVLKDRGDAASVSEGRLAVRGSTGARHAAEWEGDLRVTCRLIPDGTKDFGSFVASADTATDYLTYSIGETFFHAWDNHAGGDTGMMKFGAQFSDFKTGGYTGFRYMAARMPKEPTKPGKPIAFAFGRKGENAFLVAGDIDLDAFEPGNKMRHVFLGFYAIKSAVAVDDVTIEGTLAARWLEQKRVALKTSKPIVAEAPAAEVDPAVTAAVEAYKAGKDSPTRLVDFVKDVARPEADRKAAAAALKKGPRSAVNAVVDLLYNPDEKVRAAGIDVVKGLLGKTYGYDPKAGEKARSAAIKRMRKDLEEHPELLQGTGG